MLLLSLLLLLQNLDISFNFLYIYISVSISGLVSGVILKRILVPLFHCGFAPYSSQQDLDLFQRKDICYDCSQMPAGPCGRVDFMSVFNLDSINHVVGFWYKNVLKIPETAGMFQSFVTCIAWLRAHFSFLLWNLTALIVAQMFWVVLNFFF